MKLRIFTCLILMLSKSLFANELDTDTKEAIDRVFAIQKEIEKRELSGESPFNSGKLTMDNKDSYIDKNLALSQGEQNQSYANPNYQNTYNDTYPQNPQNPQEISEETLLLMKQALRNKNLRAVQQKFLNKQYTGYENTLEIPYEENKTQKIRTRFSMATTLIFDADIASFILGDSSGFRAEDIPNMQNAISIKPLLIGIDTNLTIFTKDNKIHNFYIYSTDYRSKENPNLLVKITDKESQEIMKRLKEEEERKHFTIKEGIAKIKVEKSKMDYNYTKRAKRENEWLLPSEVFSDDTFTYFKYEKQKNNKIPTIFAVIDRKDVPIETKIIGDYIIAESRNPKWTIWSGDSYVCIEKTKTNTRSARTTNQAPQKAQNILELHKIETRELK